MNEKNNFKILISFLIWEFKWEEVKWVGKNTDSP